MDALDKLSWIENHHELSYPTIKTESYVLNNTERKWMADILELVCVEGDYYSSCLSFHYIGNSFEESLDALYNRVIDEHEYYLLIRRYCDN